MRDRERERDRDEKRESKAALAQKSEGAHSSFWLHAEVATGLHNFSLFPPFLTHVRVRACADDTRAFLARLPVGQPSDAAAAAAGESAREGQAIPCSTPQRLCDRYYVPFAFLSRLIQRGWAKAGLATDTERRPTKAGVTIGKGREHRNGTPLAEPAPDSASHHDKRVAQHGQEPAPLKPTLNGLAPTQLRRDKGHWLCLKSGPGNW